MPSVASGMTTLDFDRWRCGRAIASGDQGHAALWQDRRGIRPPAARQGRRQVWSWSDRNRH